jgi:hypothetical protein
VACKCARGVTTMPRAAISESELDALLTAILNEGGRSNAERLLETQHQYTPSGSCRTDRSTSRWKQTNE